MLNMHAIMWKKHINSTPTRREKTPQQSVAMITPLKAQGYHNWVIRRNQPQASTGAETAQDLWRFSLIWEMS
jgi:hypothetical protein